MQPAAQVQAVIELFADSITTSYPADRLMANYFRSRRYIGSKDKAAISELFYTVLRQRLSLEFVLEVLAQPSTPSSLVAVQLQLDGLDIANIFTGQRYQPQRLANIDSISRASNDIVDSAPEHVRLNVPAWIEPELKSSLGENYPAEMRASLQRASTDVRVNHLKTDQAALQAAFEKQGWQTKLGRYSPWSLRFERRVGFLNLPQFKQGWFEVQDEGSQLLALLTDASAGQKVVDFCAGAGGKSLAMAAMMENKGTLYASDVHSKRLAELEKRARRAGVHNIRTHLLNSEHDKWVKQHQRRADIVLVDAPCSGTGTWRRNPDSRWNLTAQNLENLRALQSSILASASRLVKPGGRLVYATCSLLQSENEKQVAQFLQASPEYSRISLPLPETIQAQAEPSEVRLLSSQHQTDGFFVASLMRKG